MNMTSQALSFKFLMTLVFASLTLWLFDQNSFTGLFIYTLTTTGASYLIGDLAILPSAGNLVASISDGILAIIIAQVFSAVLPGFRSTLATVVALGILISIGEYFFHHILLNSPRVAP